MTKIPFESSKMTQSPLKYLKFLKWPRYSLTSKMTKNFIVEDLELFWSFYQFQSIFVILEALVYLFSHARGFEGIFVILGVY